MTGILRVKVSGDERRKILDDALFGMLSDGDRVLFRLPDRAVLVTGKPVRHLLHVAVSFCCWLWVPVWLFQWLFGGERAMTLEVDEYGEVHAHLQSLSALKMVVIAALVIGWLVAVTGLTSLLLWLIN